MDSSSTVTSADNVVQLEDNEVEVVTSEAPSICVSYRPPSVQGDLSDQSVFVSQRSDRVDFDSMADTHGDTMLSGGLIQDLFSSSREQVVSEGVVSRSGTRNVNVQSSTSSVINNDNISNDDTDNNNNVEVQQNHNNNNNILPNNMDDLRSFILNTIQSVIPRNVNNNGRGERVGGGGVHGRQQDSRDGGSDNRPPAVVRPSSERPSVSYSAVPGQGVREQERELLGFAGSSAWLPSSQGAVTSSPSVVVAGARGAEPRGHSSHYVPAVPSRFVTRIQRGEFICFHSLFSAMTSSHNSRSTGYSFTVDDALEEVEEGRGREDGMVLSVRPRRSQVKIEEFVDWMRTWNEYVAVLSHFQPHLIPQLFRYQAVITRFAERFEEHEDWLSYDAACRRLIANNPSLTYDDVIANTELYDIYLRNAKIKKRFGRHQRGEEGSGVSSSSSSKKVESSSTGGATVKKCYSCGKPGHIAQHCSKKSGQSSNSGPQGFRDPQRSAEEQGPCYQWNDHGFCNDPNCRWFHRCSQCDGPHPRSRGHKPPYSNYRR